MIFYSPFLFLNPLCQNGMTPLMACSMSNNPDMARLLIDKGAVIDARTEDGSTALMASSQELDSEYFKLKFV